MIQILENHITTKNREPPYKNGGSRQIQVLSEWRDLNPRPPAPKAGAVNSLPLLIGAKEDSLFHFDYLLLLKGILPVVSIFVLVVATNPSPSFEPAKTF